MIRRLWLLLSVVWAALFLYASYGVGVPTGCTGLACFHQETWIGAAAPLILWIVLVKAARFVVWGANPPPRYRP